MNFDKKVKQQKIKIILFLILNLYKTSQINVKNMSKKYILIIKLI